MTTRLLLRGGELGRVVGAARGRRDHEIAIILKLHSAVRRDSLLASLYLQEKSGVLGAALGPLHSRVVVVHCKAIGVASLA